jgi:hypothetical protein
MPKIISKALLCAMVISIAALLPAAETLAADICQDQCTVDTKFGPISIAILPDSNNQWPVVVKEPGDYRCDDPNSTDPYAYPCLAWPFQCLSGPCEKIANGFILIPNCCDKPIEILWTSHGSPPSNIFECDNRTSNFPNVCSGYELRLPNQSGSNPARIFWFTTPEGIGTNMIDIVFPIQGKPTTCLKGIKGPGCNTPIPPVRVEPRRQCYQFIAEQPPECPNSSVQSTWLAEWSGTEPCAVEVWAAYGDNWNCDNVKTNANKLEPEDLGTIQDNGQILSDYITNNSLCNEGWLRFEEPETGCNKRCYVSGRKKYCF